MTSPGRRPVFVLNLHADYGCRQSGACCTAGWDVPVDPGVAVTLDAALLDGRLPPPAGAWRAGHSSAGAPAPPAGAAAVLATDASGACVFLDRALDNACHVHRHLGHGSLPAACRHFPRVTLLDQRGVHVTLSHFCPTAAALLFREDVPEVDVVADPPAFAAKSDYEGFDATRTIPPLLRPETAFDDDAYARWERWVVRTLGREDLSPEAALEAVARAAEALRSWTPVDGPLGAAVARGADGAWRRGGRERRRATSAESTVRRAGQAFARVTGAVGQGLSRPVAPDRLEDDYAVLVEPAWESLQRPVRRYLAAKAFAAWSAYQGQGVRTNVAVLVLALGVLQVEAARQAGLARRPLDAVLLGEAFRQADLLLEHLVDRADLTQLVAGVEFLDSGEALAGFPL